MFEINLKNFVCIIASLKYKKTYIIQSNHGVETIYKVMIWTKPSTNKVNQIQLNI